MRTVDYALAILMLLSALMVAAVLTAKHYTIELKDWLREWLTKGI